MAQPVNKRKLLLSKEEKRKIWGKDGPYSEAYFIIETRIQNDDASKIFLEVAATINPLTFELVKKHKEQFADNKRICDILKYAEYTDEAHGYKVSLFSIPYDHTLLEVANQVLEETEDAIKRMHTFTINHFDINAN